MNFRVQGDGQQAHPLFLTNKIAHARNLDGVNLFLSCPVEDLIEDDGFITVYPPLKSEAQNDEV